MIQFSVRQLDTIKTPVLDKILQLYKFYLVSFLICLAATLAGLAYLIMTGIQSCSIQQIHIFAIVSILFYACLVGDMLLSEKATLKFFNENCKNLDLAQNAVFKTFLQSVERLRYYSNQKEVSIFQVREVLWNSMQISYHKFFFMAQVITWILYGISFFFAVNQIGKGCIHQHESLIIFVIYLYHNFWFIILVGFSIVVSISAILFLPFLICAYFRFNDSEIPDDPEEQQKIFLQNQLENFKYDSTKAKDTLCAICLDDFQADCPVKRTKCCKSIYHQACIKEWVTNSLTCPNCRKTPFTKSKGQQEVRIDSVVPLNSNGLNTELNNNQNDQNQANVQQPVLEGQNPAPAQNQNINPEVVIGNANIETVALQNQNQELAAANQVIQQAQVNGQIVEDIENKGGDIENLGRKRDKSLDNSQQQEQNNNEIILQRGEQNKIIHQAASSGIEIVIIKPQEQNQILSHQNQNMNIENQDSYIINFSDVSGRMPEEKNRGYRDINDIQNNDDIHGEPIQTVEHLDDGQQNKDASFDYHQGQNESSNNSKERKKYLSTTTQADATNTMNNNQISELHGQRLTINFNGDGQAANSTEVSTQKIQIHSKHIDLHHPHLNGMNEHYEINDFENINEIKNDIDLK